MESLSSIMKTFLLLTQFLAALIAFIYFFKLKEIRWKLFSVYLIIICLQEHFWTRTSIFSIDIKNLYFLFVGLPLEFIFLYWLYAQKSLKKIRLFLLVTFILIGVILCTYNLENIKDAHSLILNVGSLLLIILVTLEYFKQIKNDDILKFKENKMFYINVGVVLFYVGSLPFHVFQKHLYQKYPTFVENYYLYFLISNCIMYLLFAASFIWGKEQS